MSDNKIILIALSDEQCDFGRVKLSRLMEIAQKSELKLEKRVLIENEQKFYSTLCDRIEFYAHRLLSEGKVESCDLGSEYLDIVSMIKLKFPDEIRSFRLMSDFCLKEQVGLYINNFENITKKAGVFDRVEVQKKLEFYRKAKADNKNVVELTQFWTTSMSDIKEDVDSEKLKESFLSLEISDSITEDRGGGHFVALKNQIEKVAEETKNKIPAAVNFSELRHDVIAEILHEFVYKGGRPLYVPVIYADGSEAAPFPLFCLKQKSEQSLLGLREQPVLNVGMMSARHSNDGLDTTVRVYWFRNQEISIGRTQAETDEVAYKKSKDEFLKMRSEGIVRIAFYQTGFQPAVVGFYRALAEELIFREKMSSSLEVTPYYFMGGVYKVGKVWN